MGNQTYDKYLKLVQDIEVSNLGVNQYCKEHNLSRSLIDQVVHRIKQDTDSKSEKGQKILDIWNKIISEKRTDATLQSIEKVETDSVAETSYIRDEEGKIQYYNYQIFRKGRTPLTGKLSREEMNSIHRLYSYYGDSLTQRIISRHFVDLSLIDFKRILRAFNITKASAPFAPHEFEEKSEDELREIQLREKENSFLRKAEEDQIKNNEKLLRKYAQENIDLKNKLNALSDINFTYPEVQPIEIKPHGISTNNTINLYIADMHLGSMVLQDSAYNENKNYGVEECKRRLYEILKRTTDLGYFDTINLVLMGDNIDCCQFAGKTARLDHDMPYNMQPRDQANEFINIMLEFVNQIVNNQLANNINIYSVPCGNHSGNFEYLCNKALLAMISAKYPDIHTTLWEEFYGTFLVGTHKMVVLHGKDFQFMKKPFPLNLDDKTKTLIYDWLEEKGIHGDNVHIVKGDLHSNALSSCKRFDYRNVLSLFGASDYSNANYSRNAWGLSYDMFINNNLVRGTFENI